MEGGPLVVAVAPARGPRRGRPRPGPPGRPPASAFLVCSSEGFGIVCVLGLAPRPRLGGRPPFNQRPDAIDLHRRAVALPPREPKSVVPRISLPLAARGANGIVTFLRAGRRTSLQGFAVPQSTRTVVAAVQATLTGFLRLSELHSARRSGASGPPPPPRRGVRPRGVPSSGLLLDPKVRERLPQA
jgi:hypothetical protein